MSSLATLLRRPGVWIGGTTPLGGGGGSGWPAAGTILLGTDAPNHYDWRANEYTNHFQLGRGWQYNPGSGWADAPVNAAGYPTVGGQNVITTSVFDDGFKSGAYEIETFDGTVSFAGRGVTVTAGPTTVGTRTTMTINVPEPYPGGASVLTCTTPSGFSSGRMIHTAYGGLSADPALMLTPEAVSSNLLHQGCYRFLDWMRLNGQAVSNWQDYDATPLLWSARPPAGRVVGDRPAWEPIATFANYMRSQAGSRLKAIWICVPPFVSAAYTTSLAALVESMVPDGTVVYWQYVNETTNWSYTHANRFKRMAMSPTNEAQNVGSGLVGADAIVNDVHTRVESDPALASAIWYDRAGAVIGVYVARCANAIKAGVPIGKWGSKHVMMLEGMQSYPQIGITQALTYLAKPAQVSEFGAITSYLHAVASSMYPSLDVGELLPLVDGAGTQAEKLTTYFAKMNGTHATRVASDIPAIRQSYLAATTGIKNVAAAYGISRVLVYEAFSHTRVYETTYDPTSWPPETRQATLELAFAARVRCHDFILASMADSRFGDLMNTIVDLAKEVGVETLCWLKDNPEPRRVYTATDNALNDVFGSSQYWGQPSGPLTVARDAIKARSLLENGVVA